MAKLLPVVLLLLAGCSQSPPPDDYTIKRVIAQSDQIAAQDQRIRELEQKIELLSQHHATDTKFLVSFHNSYRKMVDIEQDADDALWDQVNYLRQREGLPPIGKSAN